MSKYYRLKDFLSHMDGEHIPMTFADIEKIIEFSLPASKQYPAWWSNNPSNNPMTQEWLDAGFETESVNIPGERLVFRKVRKTASGNGGAPASPRPRHPGFGFMKGQITLAQGFDPTQPFSDDAWDRGYLGASENK